MTTLLIRRIGTHTLPPPAYAHEGDAGLDLRVLFADGGRRIYPGERVILRTGFAVAIPLGFEGQIRPRSSVFKRGLHVAHGTIDAGYRGEVRIGVANLGSEAVDLEHGERVAQLVVAPVAHCAVLEVEALDATERGEGGFGSTGRV